MPSHVQHAESPAYVVLGLVALVTALVFGAISYTSQISAQRPHSAPNVAAVPM